MHHQKKVAVIIVNYNAGALLASHLSRVFESAGDGINLRVFIVDNQSTDDSYECLAVKVSEPAFSDKVELILADRNGGFAYGNNEGIKAALSSGFQPDYFYMLNPDAVPFPEAIDVLVQEALKLSNLCILGSQMYHENGTKAASAFRFPSVISEFNRGANLGVISRSIKKSTLVIPTETRLVECDWVCGAGFLIPIEVFESLGFMDEDYFLYYEEVDYMKYARAVDFTVAVLTNSKVTHIAGVSTGIVGGKVQQAKIPLYWYESWHRYFFKNHSFFIACLSGFAWLSGRLLNNFSAIFLPRRKPVDGHSMYVFFRKALMGRS
ncbi:MAG: glycosyltransferase family 2 protein [Nitrincola lacisaponensis]|uniref:glycosyltransferase family 2 protein n=1 Tax=Nitrincola lacisaponensis TaxID=267850 RepID=UPI00391AE8E4